jgi:hypothetical protein
MFYIKNDKVLVWNIKMSEKTPMQEGEIYMPTRERVMVFATGEGPIEPTQQYSDQEVVAASDENQKPVEDPAVVCMDERESVEGAQPVREKEAGGNVTTSLHAAAAVNWSLFTDKDYAAGPEAMAEKVADHLVDTGETLGAHRHNAKRGDNQTGCGAVDKSPTTSANIAAHGLDTTFTQMAVVDLADAFSERFWREAHAGFSQMAKDKTWQSWRTSKIQELVESKGGIVEMLDAKHDAFKDPENKRHNHWGEAARINHNEGASNDRDHAKIPTFQVDVAPIVRQARKMASSEEEFLKLLHAMVLFQYGTTYTLTRNMRIIR